MFKLNLNPFFSPDSTGSGGNTTPIESGSMGKEDMIEFLNDEEDNGEVLELGKDKEPPKPKSAEKETKGTSAQGKTTEETSEETEEPEIDELAELEAELENPTEEQLELVTPVRRREILAKYPQLFKDFPYLEKAYYREQQFTELLPTIDDAKAAVAAKTTLDNYERDIMSGNTETMLRSVKETDPNAFNKIADNYLQSLARVDEKAYHHVLSNVSKYTIMAMVKEAQSSQNDVLRAAAQVLNQFVFGSSDFQPPQNLTKEDTGRREAEDKVAQREKQWTQQRFESTRTDLNTRVNNTLRNTIEAHIDPKKSMSDYVRKNASRDALETLEGLIRKDTRFRTLSDKLWEEAFKKGFDGESVGRIKTAFLSKAKTLLPAVIKKARTDALKGIGKKVVEDSEEETQTPTQGKPRSISEKKPSGKVSKASDIPRGMKSIDFLMQD